MSIRVEIFDGTTPLIDKILELSYGMALESLSVAGAKVQRQARVAMIRKKHNWLQHVAEQRVIKKGKSATRQLGLRISYEDGSLGTPPSMSSMITSFLMPKSLTVVVGGKHPSFQPRQYKDGKDVGAFGSRVKGVHKDTFSILHKLNTGERDENHNWGGSRKSMEGFKNAQYEAYNFMEEGAMMAQAGVLDAMTSRYESLLHKAVNNANIRVVKRNVV